MDNRRRFLSGVSHLAGLGPLGLLLGGAAAQTAHARSEEDGVLRVAGGWRLHEREHQIGSLRLDWQRGKATIESAHTVASLPPAHRAAVGHPPQRRPRRRPRSARHRPS